MIECKVARTFPGSIFGFQHPALALSFSASDAKADATDLRKLAMALEQHLQYDARLAIAAAFNTEAPDPTPLFLTLIDAFEISANMPAFARHRLGQTIFVECMDLSFTAGTVKILARLLDVAARDPSGESLEPRAKQAVDAHLSHPAVANLRKNSYNFAEAAHDMHLPLIKLPTGLMQFGWGERSMVAVSTMTQDTSLVSSQMVRDKALARAILAAARLPTTDQRNVRTYEQAVAAAKELGYPVVVKPRALDGGRGVTTSIGDTQALRTAFDKASALSQRLLVEKQLFGGEYRLVVVHDKLLAIYERVPAQVTGNGKDTVTAIIDAENARREAIEKRGQRAIQIAVVDETEECLAGQGLTMESVPADGQLVRLATVPKMATGGVSRPVDPSEFHPDNIDAVLRAVRFVRLDVAGVDFLTPDPSVSWREGVGKITEVNAVPEINRMDTMDVFTAVLEELVPGDGRLPCVLLAGRSPDAMIGDIVSAMGTEAQRLGIIVTDAALAERLERDQPAIAAVGDTHAVLRDPLVASVLVVQQFEDILARGFALDRFDAIVLSDVPDAGIASQLCGAAFQPYLKAAEMVCPAHDEQIASICGAGCQVVEDGAARAEAISAKLRRGGGVPPRWRNPDN